MPDYGISIEKKVSFRGFQQPFANVYYYRAATVPVTSTAILEAFLDTLVAKEKAIHSSDVSFTRGRVWNTNSGSQSGNQMRVDKTLSGVGACGGDSTMDRERAILVFWDAGLSSTNKPVKLRKWYHVCGKLPNASFFSDASKQNTAKLTSTEKTSLSNALTNLRVITQGVDNFELIAKSGRQATDPMKIHDYLEHHQLGDQWR